MSTDLKSHIDDYQTDWQDFRDAVKDREPAWLQDLRRRAMDRFTALGWPSHRQEEWKYNNLKSLPDIHFISGQNGAAKISADDLASRLYPGLDAHLLVFSDDHHAPSLSRIGELPAGVTLSTLPEFWRQTAAKQPEHLAKLAAIEQQPLSALNTAFMRDGLYLELAAGKRLDRPIHVLYLCSAGDVPGLVSPRTLVVAGAGSEATIIESHVSLGEGAHFVNAVSELVCGDNAEIRHIKLQRQNEAGYHIGTTAVSQGRDSRYRAWEFNLGADMARKETHVELAGEGARCELNNLFLGHGEQRLDNRTRVVHTVPHCSTRELYKGILDDKAQGIFDGLIYVAQDAQRTDAQQTNRNLLLSEYAVANSLPQLEIYADDVKCTHGATSGQLDEEQIFYLRSRGFSQESARALLTHAFAREIIDGIELESVQRDLEDEILRRLPQGDLIRESP